MAFLTTLLRFGQGFGVRQTGNSPFRMDARLTQRLLVALPLMLERDSEEGHKQHVQFSRKEQRTYAREIYDVELRQLIEAHILESLFGAPPVTFATRNPPSSVLSSLSCTKPAH